METSIQKWGNSLAIRIPKAFADALGISDNGMVNLTMADGKLTIAPIQKPQFTLDSLLAGVTDDNIHGEYDIGEAQGQEVW
ncbi:MAG: AbrB/MazE/SpoVT family DNA-binding domain-containing protein [Herpetosiphon sp.]|nr:AbrB/MazE/SpoVT family DNA-binding domain-containing protein [Herpetosiphon sp.]